MILKHIDDKKKYILDFIFFLKKKSYKINMV